MTFQHSSTAFHTRSNEAPFEIEDILVTRTNVEGVIQDSNACAQRVMGFEQSDLDGASHTLVRHPDMPKCVFHLLWQHLGTGAPVGTYFMNKAKDGRVYWAYAMITPVDGGFVSTQVKPSSPVFDQIRDVYRDLLEAEKAGVSIEDSVAQYLKRLAELGFNSYAAFSAEVFVMETAARRKEQGQNLDRRLSVIEPVLVPLKELINEQEELMQSFEAIRGIPSNMRIVASRLEPAGGPISAISQNYRLMSDEVTAQLRGFLVPDGSKSLSLSLLDQVEALLSSLGSCLLYEETLEKHAKGLKPVDEDFVPQGGDLETLMQAGFENNRTGLVEVSKQVERLARTAKDVRQLVTGLDSIRVLCRVEAGRLGVHSATLLPVIDALDKFHKRIDTTLERIMSLAEVVGDISEAARRNC